jgi:hypothetical protein
VVGVKGVEAVNAAVPFLDVPPVEAVLDKEVAATALLFLE